MSARAKARPPLRRYDNELAVDDDDLKIEEQPCPTCEAKGHCPTCGGKGRVLPAEAMGALLRARRLESKVTIRQVAGKMGVASTYVGDLELGQRRITPALKQRYIDALEECGGY